MGTVALARHEVCGVLAEKLVVKLRSVRARVLTR